MRRFLGSALSFVVLVSAGCDDTIFFPDELFRADGDLRQQLASWGVTPIDPSPRQDPARVALGRALFFDKILSGNRDIACATCHEPEAFLGDGLSLSVGTGGAGRAATRTLGAERQFVPRHAPALFNAGLGLFYMFWDGRLSGFDPGTFLALPDSIFFPEASNILAAQAMLPVLSRVEMRGNADDADVFGNPNELGALTDDQPEQIWQGIMRRLLAIPEYVAMFAAAFPDTPRSALRFQHAAEAIAAFEIEGFTATDSPLDRYIAGDEDALSEEGERGGELFTGEGLCITCHNGQLIGGQDFANVGAPQVGPGIGKEPPLDLGRGELDEFDFYRFAFRVPPLRNVELTAPYMHSGAYPTLEAVVDHYSDVPKAVREYDVLQLAPGFRDSYHGDAATVSDILSSLDFRLSETLHFSQGEKRELVAFLRAMTDPRARDLRALVPESVPSGLPVR
ncbi:MAG: cytochrome c peroxidase [Gemmatimonadales bacterium]